MKKNFVVMILCAFLLAACASEQSANPIIGTWLLVSYGPASEQSPVLPDLNRSLIIDAEGKINGNVGCNSFVGSYSIDESKISFEPEVSTQLACVPEIIMKQEEFTLLVLNNTPEFKIEGRFLTLWTDDGMLVFESDGN